jgi:hypothetical protein
VSRSGVVLALVEVVDERHHHGRMSLV